MIARKIKGINSFIDDLQHNDNKQECHTIVFIGNLWYNCDKQEYPNFAMYKMFLSLYRQSVA